MIALIFCQVRPDRISRKLVALMLLDSASIATSELAADSYGATTAGAVLAYKRKRNIITLSYQSTADKIVGRMTIASLDSEIAARNAIQKRSGCDYAPVGRPKRKQHFFAFAASGLELVNAGSPGDECRNPLLRGDIDFICTR